MLLNEVLKFASSNLLPLFLVENIVIMFDNLLAALPVQLDYVRHVLRFPLEFQLKFACLTLLVDLFLGKMLLGRFNYFFGVCLLFLELLLEVVSHPSHLLKKEIPMSFVVAM